MDITVFLEQSWGPALEIFAVMLLGALGAAVRLAFGNGDKEPMVAAALGATTAAIVGFALDVWTPFELEADKLTSFYVVISFVAGFLVYDILDGLKGLGPAVKSWISRTGKH